MPKLFRVLVPAAGIEVAAAFYEQVLGFSGMRVSPGRHYFDCGGTVLACFDPEADGDGRAVQPNPESIYLAVDDLEDTYEHCRRAGARLPDGAPPGAGPLGEIADRPWGERSFYVIDPTGNEICFVSSDSVFRG